MAMEDDMPTTASSAAGGQQEPGKSRSVDHDALDSEIEKQRSIALQVSLLILPPFFCLTSRPPLFTGPCFGYVRKLFQEFEVWKHIANGL